MRPSSHEEERGSEESSQPRYNYMEMCSISLHLRGTCHIHIAVIAIVTKRSLFEYHSFEAFAQTKANVIRSVQTSPVLPLAAGDCC